MKSTSIMLAGVIALTYSCHSPRPFHEKVVDNPEFVPNTAFVGYEDLTNPKFAALKEKYQLDTIFHGETDELKRILLLRHWIRSVITINDPGPHPGDGSAESILDHALKGAGYHCGHYMVVQNAVMNAYGYVTRCLGAGPGGQDGVQTHHGIDEIWLNSYHKWFLSDAKYDHHFEKNGVPLSALEIRDEYLKNKAADITMVNGPGRIPVDYDEVYKTSKEHFARTYSWIEWDTYVDRYTPKGGSNDDRGILTMFGDDYFKSHTWMWDNKPHWAYNTKYMKIVSDRKAIEWTPNTVTSKVTINGSDVKIELRSNTPNLKSYQMKEMPDSRWTDVSTVVQTKLKNDRNEMIFRTVNLAGVTGPEHQVIVER